MEYLGLGCVATGVIYLVWLRVMIDDHVEFGLRDFLGTSDLEIYGMQVLLKEEAKAKYPLGWPLRKGKEV